MQNRDLKKELLQNEVFDRYCKRRNDLWEHGFNPYQRSNFPFLQDEEYHACAQLYDCKKKQRKKVEAWLEYWLAVPNVVILFGTQSFNDTALSRSFSARQKAVQRMLTQFEDYVSNVDYGKKNDREHYHFIVIVNEKDLKEVDWKQNKRGRLYVSSLPQSEAFLELGWQNWQKIDQKDPKIEQKLSGYVAKLVSHSLKVKQSRLGYKRESTYQIYKKELEWHKDQRRKNHGTSAEALIQAERWKENRDLMLWLQNGIDYPMP